MPDALTHMPTKDVVDAYLRHLEQDRHLASSTIAGYRAELGQLLARRVPLTAKGVVTFIGFDAAGTALAPTTRNRRLVVVRGFVAYLLRTRIVTVRDKLRAVDVVSFGPPLVVVRWRCAECGKMVAPHRSVCVTDGCPSHARYVRCTGSPIPQAESTDAELAELLHELLALSQQKRPQSA